MPTAAAKYKTIRCYLCGKPLTVSRFSDIWTMNIDGKPHQVQLYAVPCMRCEDCDITLTDSGSDEAIQWAYIKYCREHNLYTPWRRLRRWVRSVCERLHNRYQRWLVR